MAAYGVCHGTSRPWTVREEIGLALFGDQVYGEADRVQFSPDGAYFAAHTERGRMDLNRPEDTLRIYRTADVLDFLKRTTKSESPSPIWSFSRSTAEKGPIINRWVWLADSSGIAYIERSPHDHNRLVLADVTRKSIETLTPEGQSVRAFDIRDRMHYVYAVEDPEVGSRIQQERNEAAIVATGRSFLSLVFPPDPDQFPYSDRSVLWAVVDGKCGQVRDRESGQPVVLFAEGKRRLALSPDGSTLVTALPVPEIPASWEGMFPPPYAAFPYRLRAGRQDLTTFQGYRLASQYVVIDLRSGTVRSLLNSPTASDNGWWESARPVWSRDGKGILVADGFIASSTRPCIAYVDRATGSSSCIQELKGSTATGYEKGYYVVTKVRFLGEDRHAVLMSASNEEGITTNTEYRLTTSGHWAAGKPTALDDLVSGDLRLSVKEGLNEPPVLMADNPRSRQSAMIMDPNPQLHDIARGEVTVYPWTDITGRQGKGLLFKPVPYQVGQRYPLIIQTHGFVENQFRPSGVYTTAFAARGLSAVGFVVIQMNDCPAIGTSEELRCSVYGYEAAVKGLVADGLVDPDQIGIIGFSRSCLYVMQALTTSALHIKAATITDGVMADYLQYLLEVDEGGNGLAHDYDAIIGAPPFGGGLRLWLQSSPLFNFDRVTASLLVVAEGPSDLPFMWGPYAAMRYLHKPTELVLLNTSEHVLTNPAARLVSQGGSVEWFRFWLQGYEDPDQAKLEQYRRWEELCDVQVEQNPDQPGFCVHSKAH